MISMAQPRMKTPVERFNAISDGIFAIAMTIMVLEIKVPHFSGMTTTSDIQNYFEVTVPTLLTFVLSFMVLANMWVSHSRLPVGKNGLSRHITIANFYFLLFVCLIPAATALINQAGFRVLTVQAICIILAVATLTLGRLRLLLYKQENIDAEELHNHKIRIAIAAILSIIGINVTFFGDSWQPALFIGYALVIMASFAFRYKQPKETTAS